jgi:hypothetical protein
MSKPISASACSLLAASPPRRLGSEALRQQQRLDRHAIAIGRLQPLVQDPLVRRVHVDEHQPVAVSAQDVDAMQLRECKPERRRPPSTGGSARRRAARAALPNSVRKSQRFAGTSEARWAKGAGPAPPHVAARRAPPCRQAGR